MRKRGLARRNPAKQDEVGRRQRLVILLRPTCCSCLFIGGLIGMLVSVGGDGSSRRTVAQVAIAEGLSCSARDSVLIAGREAQPAG